jgi:ABC-2 type transport system ATP-binding protein
VRPSRGRALLGGLDARRPAARRRLGYLPERPAFPPHLTAAELLDREGRMFRLGRAERRARTLTLAERVGLADGVFRRRVATYSKGERARLGIALALVGDPLVVLLDEPTDGLDPLGRKAVRELLLNLKSEGRAVLLNSHLLAEVEACCDRVVILDRGRVAGEGSADQLLAERKSLYRVRLAEPPSAALVEALRALPGSVSVEADELRLALDDCDQLDPHLAALHDAGARLRELRPETNLEDVFVALVGGGDPGPTPTPPEGSVPAPTPDAESGEAS